MMSATSTPFPAASPALAEALALHQQGRLPEAEARYARILIKQPGNVAVRYHQGLARLQRSDLEGSIGAFRQVLKLAPDHAEAHFNLGNAYLDQCRLDDAAACFTQAIALHPAYAAAHYNLAVALRDRGDLPGAAASFSHVIAIQPHFADAHCNLGDAQLALGRPGPAEASYRLALAIQPLDAEAHNKLGLALQGQGQHAEAVEGHRRALAIQPGHAMAHYNLGTALHDLDRDKEAAQSLRRAIALRPDFADAHYVLGVALAAQGQAEEAASCYRRALALAPDHAEACGSLGNALKELGQLDGAAASFRRALEINSDIAEAHFNLGNALLELGQLDDAMASYRRALEAKPDYAEALSGLGGALLNMGLVKDSLGYTRRAVEAMPGDDGWTYSNLLLALNYVARPAQQVFREHLDFGERFGGLFRETARSWPNRGDAARALRVGYLSPDFRTHSVAYFTEPILACHDRSGFEVFCYAEVPRSDAVTERLRKLPVSWRNIHLLTDEQVCERIREDGIDILVDLAGHTGNNRMMVFVRKPAPVQVSYVGYPNTTGLAEMDYRVTDAWADPEGLTDPFHTEKLIRLPHGFLCYRPDIGSPPVAALPALALGHVTFGSFNNLTKVTDEMIALWCRVLNAVPDSRFVFKAKALADEAVRGRIEKAFAEQGVERHRLDLLAQIPSTEGHLAAYHGIDIALDTFPYHGTTTTFEALWMGVPVVTLAGQVHAARVGVSILSRMGLPELIAATPEDYVRIATEWAHDLSKLKGLRQTMRQRMAERGLMDGETITRELEAAYRDMWRCCCAKQSGVVV